MISIIVTIVGNNQTRVQILNEVVCILLHANALGKDMNPFGLPPAKGK